MDISTFGEEGMPGSDVPADRPSVAGPEVRGVPNGAPANHRETSKPEQLGKLSDSHNSSQVHLKHKAQSDCNLTITGKEQDGINSVKCKSENCSLNSILTNSNPPQITCAFPQKTSLDILTNSQGSLHSLSNSGGCVLSFHSVNYSVNIPVGRCRCGKTEKKAILKDVSGLFRPGLNAILGPTGSGKTSLLDVLAGRKERGGLSGRVLVDGAPQPHNFKCMAGYVIQDDIVMGMLTVRENIAFSAALRFPKSVSNVKRKEHIEEVIAELGLTKCADTRVGTAFARGVSGGERKRTNIAMELITSPAVLFLDEPTTGLDATTAYSVLHLLQRLSRKGKTIVFSIHQPRYAIFKLFDTVLLMNHGNNVYHGPAKEALDYFRSIGYLCEEHNNPPDFFLDVLNGVVTPTAIAELPNNRLPPPEARDKENEKDGLIVEMEEDTDSVSRQRQEQLVQQYNSSPWRKSLDEDLAPILEAATAADASETRTLSLRRPHISYPTNFFMQLCIVGNRTFRNMARNPHTLATQIVSALVLSLLVGSIYYQVDDSFRAGIQNRVGAFFFIVMNYVFGNMTAMDVFIRDRAVFIHENISGYYRVSAYFFSKMLCDVTPQRFFPILVFSSVSYWMIGLSPTFYQFLFYVLNIILTSMAGTSVALVFSASVATHSIGSLMTALVWLLMMVFSGLLVNIETIPAWLRWVKWLSIFRYSMNAFSVNELKDAKFCDNNGNTTTSCDYGNNYMDRQGIPYETTWDLWFNEVMLIVLATAFLILTYVQLRRMKKLQ